MQVSHVHIFILLQHAFNAAGLTEALPELYVTLHLLNCLQELTSSLVIAVVLYVRVVVCQVYGCSALFAHLHGAVLSHE